MGNSRQPSKPRFIGVDLADEPDRSIAHNIRDGRNGNIGSWEVKPLVYDELGPEHIGRTVIYHDHGRAEAGTITSWRDGIVFARYSRGDTASAASPDNLWLAVAQLR